MSKIAILIAAMTCAPFACYPQSNTAGRGMQFPTMIGGNVGIYECDVGTSAGNAKRDCSNIPVVVMTDDAGCYALLPYAELRIHGGVKNGTVSWALVAPVGFVFDDSGDGSNDEDGISILTYNVDKPHKIAFSDIWKGARSTNKQTFTYTFPSDASAATHGRFKHQANVLDPTGKPCQPADPIIGNS